MVLHCVYVTAANACAPVEPATCAGLPAFASAAQESISYHSTAQHSTPRAAFQLQLSIYSDKNLFSGCRIPCHILSMLYTKRAKVQKRNAAVLICHMPCSHGGCRSFASAVEGLLLLLLLLLLLQLL